MNTLLNVGSFGVAYNTQAQAYFTASGVSNAAYMLAVSNFFTAVQATSGLYAKMLAWYFPFWGTAALDKWNAVNPVDSDGAFRLTFNGTVSHLSNGIQGNGTTGYCDTHFVPNTSLTMLNGTFGMGINSSTTSGVDMGCNDGSQTLEETILAVNSYGDNNAYYNWGHNAGDRSVASPGTVGFWGVNRGATVNTTDIWRNGSKIGTSGSLTSDGLSTRSFYLMVNNNAGTPTTFSNRIYWFGFFATGLTDADMTAFSTAVANLKTALGI